MSELIEKVRAAEAIGLRDKSEQVKLNVFMALFHPDHEPIVLEDNDECDECCDE